MRIAVLCSSREHPVYQQLLDWAERQRRSGHYVSVLNRVAELPRAGEILFLVSCSELVRSETVRRFEKALVLHASDLPDGRGWSPHVWEIIEGGDHLTVSLIEAAEKVDTGDVWKKKSVPLDGTELYDEINEKLFASELELMDFAVNEFENVVAEPQDVREDVRHFPKRSPEDSRIDPDRSITSQFDLLRVCDPERFPAFFDLRGARYLLNLKKVVDG